MQNYVDEMLQLTADIAEELLLLKDSGGDIAESLVERTSRLAALAEMGAGSCAEPVPQEAPSVNAPESAAPDCYEDIVAESDQVSEAEPEETAPPAPEVAVEPEAVPHDSETEAEPTVEPTVGAASVRSLRKAFSLNDLFFYRRVLFRGSQELFNEALEALSSASSPDDAAAVMRDRFRIDTESDDAVAFIDHITPFLA